MSQRELEDAVRKIRAEQVDEETVKTAAGRVFSRLFDAAFIASEPSGKIRGCADVRALFPAYLQKTLGSARVLLVEDHVVECVDCRRALEEARTGESAARPIPAAIPIDRGRRGKMPALVWAAAAALLVGVGLGLSGLLPGQNAVRATVLSVEGSLYKVTDLGVSLVEAGEILKNSDELRTAKGSHAILRLAGGAMVEIAERSDVAVAGGWRGASVNLERGQMIVDARGEGAKPLRVTSGEMTVPVSGGVVAFDHGTKESRVAVAKGSVEVSVGAAAQTVSAGQLYGGELRAVNLPVASEFAWSQNKESYLALLNELEKLQKDWQAIPGPGLRYASNLAQYLPADTYVYAAVPNLGGTISEAKKLFDNRLSESEALRKWWQQQPMAKNGEFDRMIDQVSAISGYLGDEIVVAAGGGQSGPVLLAQIKQPGLAEYVERNLPAAAGVEIVTGGAAASGNKLLIDMDNNVLAAAMNGAQLQRVEAAIAQRAGGFSGTPLFARIGQIYANGAGYFLAADLKKIGEQSSAKSVGKTKGPAMAGFENVQYLVLERKGDEELRASVSFAGARQGAASWLGAPGPAGSLNFVSPEASFAASLVMKNPRTMMQELLGMVGGSNANFQQELDDFQARSGVNLLDDVAAPLGSDVTIAMDAGLAPVLAIEVYDPTRLQQTIEVLVGRFNQQASAKSGQLTLQSDTVNGRTFHAIYNSKAPGLSAYYTFADGYLVASSSEAKVLTAIQNKESGHILADSANFRAKLPADGYANFSAMVYSHLDSSLGDLTKRLNASGGAQSIGALFANGGSGLICVYGEPERIMATAKGSFLGFNLGTLVGIQQGQSLGTIIASTRAADKGSGRGAAN